MKVLFYTFCSCVLGWIYIKTHFSSFFCTNQLYICKYFKEFQTKKENYHADTTAIFRKRNKTLKFIMPWYLQHNMTSRSFHKMLPWEICMSSNLASYWEREANKIHGNSNFVQNILRKILKGNSALVFAIIWYQCVLASVSAFV